MYGNQISDHDIRQSIDAHLARYRLDTQRIRVRVTAGIVHMFGAVYRGSEGQPIPAGLMEALERNFVTTPGVRLVHFELSNWTRDGLGTWEPVYAQREDIAPLPEEDPSANDASRPFLHSEKGLALQSTRPGRAAPLR